MFIVVPAKADPTAGVYRLTPRGQQGMALDVNGFGNANGTAVLMWYSTKASNQQWLVEPQSDGTYKISAYSGQNSLQVLDYAGGITTNGNPVTTYEDTGSDNQRWYFQDVGAGWYRIIPKNAKGTAQTLEISGGAAAQAAAAADIWEYTGGDNQVFRLDWAGVAKLYASPKKGLGGYSQKQISLHTAWFYDWGATVPANTPPGVEYVPMEWGYYGNNNNDSVNWLNGVKSQPGVKTILAFNEPDSSSQSNLSVDYALEGYQYMAALGIPVGSPACVHADDQWMQDFMSGAASRGYRVDYVTIHWYGGNDPWGFLGYVDYIHNLYGKPVWITEFCPADWSGNHGISPQQTADFMKIAVPGLNSRWYVQRFAWFSDGPGGTLGNGSLINDDGTLTDLGKLYARL